MTPTIVHVLLVAGVVVVPALGLRLLSADGPGAASALRWARMLHPVGAVAVAVSFLLEPGSVPAFLSAVWLAVAGLAAFAGLAEVIAGRGRVATLAAGVPLAFLAFGAGWLVLSRAGIRPLGFTDTVVELTAVHFLFAGFGASLVARSVWLAEANDRSRVALAALAGTVVATPLVALGITFAPPLELAGAIVFAVSLFTLSGLVWTGALRDVRPGVARGLILVSSLSVLVGASLAVVYGLGRALGSAAPDIPAMAAVHGIANGVGFVTFGLGGWLLAGRRTP